MKRKSFAILLILSTLIFSCNKAKRTSEKFVDYSNKNVLDSLIKNTPSSIDTLFLGFRMGMTKIEYKKHLKNLRKEGKNISTDKTIIVSFLNKRFELGPGNTFTTEISDNSSTGKGEYFIVPYYDNNNKLIQLNVRISDEYISGTYKPEWFKNKLRENSKILSNKNLKRALINHQIIKNSDFLRQKGNTIIYETYLSINYIDLRTLLIKLVYKETEKELIRKKSNDIKF